LTEALTLARLGLGQTSPNPAVGAVIVKDGEIVGRGFHTWAGVDHAEVIALREAGEKARGATIYLSLEPCSHTGRTGPCADALIHAGIARAVIAMPDPNPLVSGAGMARLRAAGVEVEIDECARHEAEKLNEAFVHFMRTGKPLVTLKAALTLDGKIAAPEDNAGWITSPVARAHVQTLRHRSDAILTGIGTVLADDCRLTDRSGLPRARPLLRIVLDSQLRLGPDSTMVRVSKGDLLVVCTSAASAERRKTLEAKGVEVVALDGPDGRTSIPALVRLLAERRYLSLMIEAGSIVNWAALESGVVDKIFWYYAPKILGGMKSLPVAGGAGRKRRADAIEFERVTIHPIPPDEFAIEAYVHRAD
jgi:diaminohydroxyphosphoribosylaminopyrimidine deaminase/5-amino-6-(5-phosphoribosylamino)uracil reductase